MSWLLDPIAKILGYILEYIDKFLFIITGSGIHSMGASIILFTFVVNIIMFPLTMKQQKTTKITSMITPEIQEVQAKYKGKTDTATKQKIQIEQQAIYDKYGVNPIGGCLPLLIQMPILFALFQVIKDIGNFAPYLANQNMFLGIDLQHAPYAPWVGWDRSFLIPVMAVVTQYLSTKLMTANQNQNMNTPGASSMKMMNNIMPIMSGVFCLSFGSGIGLYWIAGNVFRCIQSVFVNIHFNKIDIARLIEENEEKAKTKAAKREVMNQRVSQYSKTKTSNIKTSNSKNEENNKTRDYSINKNIEKGSISGYANMLSGSSNNKKEVKKPTSLVK